jgi:hypothetical protein
MTGQSIEEPFDPARVHKPASSGNMSVQIAEIQEMFFDRLENERAISFLMTQ